MKKLMCFAAAFLACAAAAFAQDAAALVQASRDRIKADTISSRSKMVIAAKDGSSSERVLDQYSKDGPNGGRAVIVFREPAGVANTRFLTMENARGSNDQWIFLPSLGKVRRIASSEGSGSFMGTDMSYDDISSADRKADLDNHRILREETLNGNACHVIESIPKDSSYQYSKMIQWIDKATKVTHKVELYDRRGTMHKRLEILELRNVQERLSPIVTRMSTLTEGTSTTIRVEILKYDDPIPEGVFTPAFLETGRAR
ncbi:MAG: outer membrane lipoprotein-sorting protein [Treponema sp.]|jgi:outer membrane lipoprotein-sorting protein|nr:outer membrane lipoprotein-sorting protein [Treponema sp.]